MNCGSYFDVMRFILRHEMDKVRYSVHLFIYIGGLRVEITYHTYIHTYIYQRHKHAREERLRGFDTYNASAEYLENTRLNNRARGGSEVEDGV